MPFFDRICRQGLICVPERKAFDMAGSSEEWCMQIRGRNPDPYVLDKSVGKRLQETFKNENYYWNKGHCIFKTV